MSDAQLDNECFDGNCMEVHDENQKHLNEDLDEDIDETETLSKKEKVSLTNSVSNEESSSLNDTDNTKEAAER